MKSLSIVLALVVRALFVPPIAAAAPSNTLYTLHLARVTDDAYRDWSSGLVVITSGCLDLTLGDDVIYNDSSRQLIFPDGETCRVSGIFRPQFQLRRVDQDLYRDVAGRGYLRTFACYVYTYGEDVIILDDSVVFLDSGERCQRALS